jgi:hypothetical protein
MAVRLADNALEELECVSGQIYRASWFKPGSIEANAAKSVSSFEDEQSENWLLLAETEVEQEPEKRGGANYYCTVSPTGATLIIRNNVVVGGSLPRFRREEPGKLVTWIEAEAQSECEPQIYNYYAYTGAPASARAIIHDNDAAVSGAVVIGGGIAVDSNAVFSGGLTIRGQMPANRFHISTGAWELRILTPDLEQLTWDKCRQVLLDFTSYAKEILKRKSIAIIDTRIRNWQAIDDTNWKQCILDITIEAKSHIALRVWDELTEELQKFINTQPAVIRPFIEDKLSLDVKWV